MDKKTLLELGLLIPILTVFVFAGVYYFELGYFRFFGIPSDFIEVEVTKNIVILFLFISISALLIFLTNPLLSNINLLADKEFKRRFHWSLTLVLIIILVVLSYVNIKPFLVFFSFIDVWVIIGAILFGCLVSVNVKNERSLAADFYRNYPVFNFIWKNGGRIVGPVLITLGICCFIAFIVGYQVAESKHQFYQKGTSKSRLLRHYSDISIYEFEDRVDTLRKSFIIEYSPDKLDTIEAMSKIR